MIRGLMLMTLFSLVCVAGPAGAGTLIVANKSDDTVTLLDAADGEVRATLPTGPTPHEVAVSPDGRWAAVSNYGKKPEEPGSSLTIVDVQKSRVSKTIDLGENTFPHGMVWLEGGRLTVTTEGSKRLLVVDVERGEIVSQVGTGRIASHMVAIAGNRAFVANIGSDGVSVIDLDSATKLKDIATGAGAEGIAVTPNGHEVWVTNRAADTISIIDPVALRVVQEIPCKGFPIRIAFALGGKRALVSCARSGEIALFDVAGRIEMRRTRLDLTTVPDASKRLFGDRFGKSAVPVGLVVAPGGTGAWIAATQADFVVYLDARTLRVLDLLEAGREPDGMAYSEITAAKVSS